MARSVGNCRSCLGPVGELAALGHADLDLTDLDGLRRVVRERRPDIIVNAAAYTDVDKAESERDLAELVNAQAPQILAEEAAPIGCLLIHLSTDYVFDGQKDQAYTEKDQPNPINHYGHTKLAGEQAIQSVGGAGWIFRTSWVYSRRRPSFLTHVLAWARNQTTVRVVEDQIGSPTWCRSLADAIVEGAALAASHGLKWAKAQSGIYHVACRGATSRIDFARKILALDPSRDEQIFARVVPAKSGDFPSPAARPKNSSLNCQKFEATFDIVLPDWQTALARAMEE